MADAWKMMVDRGMNPSAQTPSSDTLQYFGYRMLSSLTMQRYLCAVPGSTLFVLPGGAQTLARALISELPIGLLPKKRQRVFVERLTNFFERAEAPLETRLGEHLVPRLVVLGIINNLEIATELQKQFPDDDVMGLLEAIEEGNNAEHLRSVASDQPAKKPTRKKRRVVMPSIKQFLDGI